MTKTITALTARTQLGQIMERARAKGERFVVSKNSKPTVVILSLDDYINNILPMPKSLAVLQQEARRRGLQQMTLQDINREIAAARRERRPKKKKNKKRAS